MNRFRMIAALALVYRVLATLLPSVGNVIVQAFRSFDVSKRQASLLESSRDLAIAATLPLLASLPPLPGDRRATMQASAIVGGACMLVPPHPGLRAMRLLYTCIGGAFADFGVRVQARVRSRRRSTPASTRLTAT